mgnify:CR=1 FL=1
MEGNPASQYFRANGILYQIMAQLFSDIGFSEENWGKNSVADEVKFYLDTNYAEKIVLKDVARSFGIHPNYMTRTFHEKFGISPKKYLMDLKLKKACRLLTTTTLSIAVISSSLGFDDQLAFSRIFRKEYGNAPSEYRKKTRGGDNGWDGTDEMKKVNRERSISTTCDEICSFSDKKDAVRF